MEKQIIDSYTAGLFDGEGTITLSYLQKKDKYRAPVLTLPSTTYKLVAFLKNEYGGYICTHKVYKSHHKQSWSWNISRNSAITMMERISPYMLEPSKLYRINLILSHYRDLTPRNGKYTKEMIEAKLLFEHMFFHPSDTVE